MLYNTFMRKSFGKDPGEKWKKLGACYKSDVTIFFEPTQLEYAKTICATCEVKKQCLDYSLFYDSFGVWGGMSEDERKILKSRLMN